MSIGLVFTFLAFLGVFLGKNGQNPYCQPKEIPYISHFWVPGELENGNAWMYCSCPYLVFDDNIQKIQKFVVSTHRILEAV